MSDLGSRDPRPVDVLAHEVIGVLTALGAVAMLLTSRDKASPSQRSLNESAGADISLPCRL